MTLLDRALGVLAKEHEAIGKALQFQTLKPWLTGDSESIAQAEAAEQLGMSEGAVKVAIHRLRRQFREVIKNEVSQTLNGQGEVDEELRHLFAALS